MRTLTKWFNALLTALVVATPIHVFAGTGVADRTAGGPVPSSIDAFYPPRAEAPLYLLTMLELDSYFSGIVVDLMESDLAGARENFEEFRRRYDGARAMVPEWTSRFPAQPLDELSDAFQEGAKDRMMRAFDEIGRTCHQCHLDTMVPVQQRHRWGDFGRVQVGDPLTGDVVAFGVFKRMLSTNLAGIGVDLRQGQLENARGQFRAFRARFQELKDACANCHDRVSRYYVDDSVQSLIERLGAVLEGNEVSLERATQLLQGIGRESCSGCHLVHVPAAMGKVAGR